MKAIGNFFYVSGMALFVLLAVFWQFTESDRLVWDWSRQFIEAALVIQGEQPTPLFFGRWYSVRWNAPVVSVPEFVEKLESYGFIAMNIALFLGTVLILPTIWKVGSLFAWMFIAVLKVVKRGLAVANGGHRSFDEGLGLKEVEAKKD